MIALMWLTEILHNVNLLCDVLFLLITQHFLKLLALLIAVVSFPHLYDFLFIITKHGEWESYQKFPARFSTRLQPSRCPMLCIPHLYYHTHLLLSPCISHFPSDTITCTSSWHSPKDATQSCHWEMKPYSKSKISSCYENCLFIVATDW